jgi:ferric-dicitrate binding protein FerR (iron transport regulator)
MLFIDHAEMKNRFSNDIFERYAAGNCTEEERTAVEAWYLNELRKDGDTPSAEQLLEAGDDIWKGIRPKRRIVPLVRWAAVAAAVLLAVLFVYNFQNKTPEGKGDSATAAKPAVKIQNKDAEGQSFEASGIENKMVRLPDGSIVILAKGSKLVLLPAFNGKYNREVELEGKAFFDVKHNPSKPFIIYTGDVRSTVLGTSFDITAIPGSKSVKVNVIRGLVEVKSVLTHWSTYLPKNTQVVFDDLHERPQRRQVNAEQELSWNRADLEFNDISLADAKPRLEEQLGYKISIEDPELNSATFTYSMRVKESPESFMKSMCDFIGASYKFDYQNKTISIQPLNQ